MRRRAGALALTTSWLLTLSACPASRPVPMPTVVPMTCAQAQCGEGACEEDSAEGARCICAPGSARVNRYTCEALKPATSGCTRRDDCAAGQVCERLTGACVALERDVMCTPRATGAAGERQVGDFCVRGNTAAKIPGCAAYDQRHACAPGLTCAPTGPTDASPLCGYPQVRGGVCRPTCDVCAEQAEQKTCAAGMTCALMRGLGGVCVPPGQVGGELCGEAMCAPGQTCALGGTLGGIASGRCITACTPKTSPSGCAQGMTCKALYPGLGMNVGECAPDASEAPP